MLLRCLDLTFSQSSKEVLAKRKIRFTETRWMANRAFHTYVHARSIGRACDDGWRTRWPFKLRTHLSQNAEHCSADMVSGTFVLFKVQWAPASYMKTTLVCWSGKDIPFDAIRLLAAILGFISHFASRKGHVRFIRVAAGTHTLSAGLT